MKKLKKIVKQPEAEVQPEEHQDPSADEEFDGEQMDLEEFIPIPDSPRKFTDTTLTPATFDAISKRFEDKARIRRSDISSFEIPEGWKVRAVVEHEEDDESYQRAAEKELIFWQKYKPELQWQLHRLRYCSLVMFKKKIKKIAK